LDYGKEDEVPEYVVEEFHNDLKENEEVEVVCPFFVMAQYDEREKTQVNNFHLGRDLSRVSDFVYFILPISDN
jgi:hypothetical protein